MLPPIEINRNNNLPSNLALNIVKPSKPNSNSKIQTFSNNGLESQKTFKLNGVAQSEYNQNMDTLATM